MPCCREQCCRPLRFDRRAHAVHRSGGRTDERARAAHLARLPPRAGRGRCPHGRSGAPRLGNRGRRRGSDRRGTHRHGAGRHRRSTGRARPVDHRRRRRRLRWPRARLHPHLAGGRPGAPGRGARHPGGGDVGRHRRSRAADADRGTSGRLDTAHRTVTVAPAGRGRDSRRFCQRGHPGGAPRRESIGRAPGPRCPQRALSDRHGRTRRGGLPRNG